MRFSVGLFGTSSVINSNKLATRQVVATQSELFRQAAECDRRGKAACDPEKKQLYKRLRDLWIWLACERSRLSSRAAADLAATIGDMQSVVDQDRRETVH